jgi:hypothetical protein
MCVDNWDFGIPKLDGFVNNFNVLKAAQVNMP